MGIVCLPCLRRKSFVVGAAWVRFSEARRAFMRTMRETPVDASLVERGSVMIDFEPRELVEEP
jgi:hypothetical protein